MIYDFTDKKFQGFPIPGKILRCSECGFLYKDFEKPLNEVYNDSYADEYLSLGEYHSGDKTREFFKRVLQESAECTRRLNIGSCGYAKRFLEPLDTDTGFVEDRLKLLDVGCGAGTALEVAREMGFKAEGVELNQKLSQIARRKGFVIYNNFVENLTFTKKYDIILMMDLIEHLTDPLAVINSLKANLSDNGVIAIYTPNHRSFIITLFWILYLFGYKKPAALTFASNHISFFDDRSIKIAAINSGMKLKKQFFEVFNSQRMGGRTQPVIGAIISFIDRLGFIFGRKPFRMVCYLKK